jgi:signal transduction histidine kinase
MNISAFVAAAAHDMKNSVCVIAAYLEDALAQLAQQPPDALPPQAAQLTTQALYETQRVNGNLVQLMAIYKLDEGMYPFDPVEVDLADFAEEALARVRPLARIKGLRVEGALADAPAVGFFDRDLIASVVVQSLFNSVRYAKSGLRLAIERTREADGTEGALAISVEDDGPGFPAFMLAQGYPAQQGIDAQTGSTGLGLYFARLVAGLHRRGARTGSTRLVNGGALGGSRFEITLP